MNIKKTFALAAVLLATGIGSSQALSLTQEIDLSNIVLKGKGGGANFTSTIASTSYYDGLFDLTSLDGYFEGIQFTHATVEFQLAGGEATPYPYYIFLGTSSVSGWSQYHAYSPWSHTWTPYAIASLEGPYAEDLEELNATGALPFKIHKFGATSTAELPLISAKLIAYYDAPAQGEGVPDGGTTAALMGGTLLGLLTLGRFLRARQS